MSLRKHLLFLLLIFLKQPANPFTVMINPAGDIKHTGREIEDTFERSVAMQCAQQLKQELEQADSTVRALITRAPGETTSLWHNASFANRMDVDLYLSLGFYFQDTIPAYLSIFYLLQQETDLWHQYNALQWYHVNNAHLINIKKTVHIAHFFFNYLQQSALSKLFVLRPVFGVPCAPLLGIKAPALYIETGLRSKNDWKKIIQPLIDCIQELIV